MTATPVRVFAGILERQSQWQRLSGSALSVGALYAVMLLGAVFASGGQPTAKPRAREELVVTLLELPKLSELRLLEATASATGDGPGGPALPSPLSKALKAEKARSVPPSKPVASAHGNPAPDTADTPVTPAPEPAAAVAEAVATPNALAAATSSGSMEPGPAAGLGAGGAGTMSGSGGAGGGGSGTGAGMGNASGGTTILPFIDGMTRPVLVSKVDPEYTREARDASVAGLILTKCVITTAGTLQRCRIVKGLPLMDQAVLSALAQWRYSPVMYQGKPAAVEYVIPVRLVLP